MREFYEPYGGMYKMQSWKKTLKDLRHPDTRIVTMQYRLFDARITIMPGDNKGNGISAYPRWNVMRHLRGDGSNSYYMNRMWPFYKYSEPVDLEAYDDYVLRIIDLPEDQYLVGHPFFRNVLDYVRSLPDDVKSDPGLDLSYEPPDQEADRQPYQAGLQLFDQPKP